MPAAEQLPVSGGIAAAEPGTLPGASPPGERQARWPLAEWLVATALGLAALAIAWRSGIKVVSAVPDVLRGLAAVLALTVACGYVPTRLLLPEELRAHFALFVALIGAAVAGLLLTVLGFAGLPLAVSLAVSVGGGALAGLVMRLRSGPLRARPADTEQAGGRLYVLAWPAWLATLMIAVVLVPMFQAGYTSVPGTNPDGMLAVGTAELLQSTYPLGSDADLPVDSMPLVWRSKYPIYYVLAGTASISGLEPIRVFAAESAAVAALVAVAFMLMARYGLGAGPRAGVLVMAVIGFDALVAHLAAHPYHNQLWGTLALPLILLFGMRFLESRSRRDAALLALFTAFGLSAYPLMVLFPVLALGAGLLVARRRRGTSSPRRRRSGRARSSAATKLAVVVAVPAALVLAQGILEKAGSAADLLLSGSSLAQWRGDLRAYTPLGVFVGVPTAWGSLAAVLVTVAALRGLRRVPRAWSVALRTVLWGGLAVALLFALRPYGEYFHFKVLAFVAPLLLTAAAVWLAGAASGSGLAARTAVAAAAVLIAAQLLGLADEVMKTGRQADRQTFELRQASAKLPAGASVRIDLPAGGAQLWAAYMLADHPLSATDPLVATTYPHAPRGRKADYILTGGHSGPSPPPDSTGPPIFDNGEFRIHRMKPTVPGRDVSSKTMRTSLE